MEAIESGLAWLLTLEPSEKQKLTIYTLDREIETEFMRRAANNGKR